MIKIENMGKYVIKFKCIFVQFLYTLFEKVFVHYSTRRLHVYKKLHCVYYTACYILGYSTSLCYKSGCLCK